MAWSAGRAYIEAHKAGPGQFHPSDTSTQVYEGHVNHRHRACPRKGMSTAKSIKKADGII